MPWHLLLASDKWDSSQHPMETVQTSSPFPHPWEGSPVTCYSPLDKLKILNMTQKKVQRSPFHQGICYARQAEFFRLLSTAISRVCANKKMFRKTKLCFFKPSGQLKLAGTFQSLLPPPPAAMAAQHRAHGAIWKFLG